MAKRQPIKTTIAESVDYWFSRVDECGLSVDAAEANEMCWRCGCKKNLERCHIIPHALGGKDEPSNIVLLCKRCHAEGPNVTDPEIMWDWIRAYGVPFYEIFWTVRGWKEYRFLYKKNLDEEIKEVLKASGKRYDEKETQKIIAQFMNEAKESAGNHFGQPYFNDATVAGIYRMAVKRLAASLNVPFPVTDNRKGPRTPWWIE